MKYAHGYYTPAMRGHKMFHDLQDAFGKCETICRHVDGNVPRADLEKIYRELGFMLDRLALHKGTIAELLPR